MIRTLGPGDQDAVLEMERRIFGVEAWSPNAVHEELASSWSHYRGIFFEDDGAGLLEGSSQSGAKGVALVAYGGIKGGVEGDLMTLAVAEGYRNRGLGQKLLLDLLYHAKELGMKKVFLEVRASNDSAQRLYLRTGFVKIGIVRDYYRDPVEDAVTMVMNLDDFPTMSTQN